MIDDYLERLTNALDHLDDKEREAVVAEVSSHLEEETAELVAGGKKRAAAQAEAIRRFGTVEDVAAGYKAGTGEVRRDGKVLLRVAAVAGRGAQAAARGVGRGVRGVGRGLRGVAKLLGIIVITSVIVAGGIAITAIALADDWVPFITEEFDARTPHEVYNRDLGEPGQREDSFYVPEDATRLELDVTGWYGEGCVQVTLTDPDGQLALQTGAICSHDSLRTTLAPMAGTWRVTYDNEGVNGWINIAYRKS